MAAATGKSRWQVSLRWLLLTWLALTVASVLGRRVYLHCFPPPIEMKHLCEIGGLDQLTQMHLQNLLIREGVASVIQGSKTYSCQVDARERERVIALLEEAAEASRPTVELRTDRGGSFSPPILVGNGRVMFAYDPDERLVEILAQKPSELTRILQAITDHETDPNLFDATPIILSVAGHRRFYLQPDGTFGLGYEVTIERVNRLPNPTATNSHTYQLYDDFRQVISLGGTNNATDENASAP